MTNNTIPFDPGYSKHVSSFMYFNEQVKAALKSFKVKNQKAFQYRKLLPQLLAVMKQEVGFYYGCLLWAAYISYENPPKEIEGNSFYGKTKEELEKYAYLEEVNYLLNFFEQYPKDLAFYHLPLTKIEGKYIKTVEIYKEFLILNESFINTKTTADIKIPPSIKKLETQDIEKIKSLIYLSTNDGNFERLFDAEIF